MTGKAWEKDDRNKYESCIYNNRCDNSLSLAETGLAIASAAKIAGGKSDEERESQLFDQFLRETGEGHGNENK